MLRWFRRVGVLLAVVAGLWALAWLGVPPLLKWQAQQRLSELLGRAVTIEAVHFSPQHLALDVEGLQIAGLQEGSSGGPPLLQVARLHADLALTSVWERAPMVEALEVDRPVLHVARTAEGRYDIDDLIARLVPASEPAPAPAEPQRFAVYNLQLKDGSLQFDDRPLGRTHRVDGLRLDLPFLTNLPAQLEVKVEPRLAFSVAGTRFDTGARATPFAAVRTADLTLAMGRLDLAPYLPYLPAALPVKLQRGGLAGEVALRFAMPEKGPQTLVLSGHLEADQVSLADRAGADLLAWDRLKLEVDEVQPLARRVALRSLQLDGSRWQVRRDAQGLLNWVALTGPAPADGAARPPAVTAPAAASAARAASVPVASPPRAEGGWQFSLERFGIGGGTVFWRDDAVRPAAALRLAELSLQVERVAWPLDHPLPLRLATLVHGAQDQPLGRIGIEGQAGLGEARLTFELSPFALTGLSPYLEKVLVPALSGELAASGELDWAAATREPARAERLQLRLSRLSVDRLRLGPSRAAGPGAAGAEAAWRQLLLEDLNVDASARSLSLGRFALQQPSLGLVRAADGRWNLQDWLVAAEGPSATTGVSPASASAPALAEPPPPRVDPGAKSPRSPMPTPAPTPSAPPWRIAVKDVLVQGGQFGLSDALAGARGPAEPLRTQIAGLRLAVQNLAWQGDRATAPWRVQLAARVGPGASPDDRQPASGSVDWKGQLGLVPLRLQGTARIDAFPVAHFAPYAADRLPLALVRAQAGFRGDLSLQQADAGWAVDTRGDVALTDVELHARQADGAVGEELLNWQRLALDGLAFALQPGGRPRLEVKEATLSDFYSRLVITEQGRFNLQDVAAAPEAAASAASAAGPAAVDAAASATPAAAAPTSAGSSAVATGGPPAPGGPPIDLVIGATRLLNGRIDFTDRFVRPNYSAALSELNGRLGAFRSGSREMAALELRGRAAGTALLDISGQLNPTTEPLALDIRAKATDLELAPLSPYAGKYAGYAIERGKLSMDVAYKIDPDGKLDAKNQVVLNQLTFGDRIESPQATKLPVLLAVALLKDRHGVIDIDLPVSGSINDPQFSVGGLIWKVILNLLGKALTAPFALLSGGGTDDLSQVEFQPGSALVAPSGGAALDKVAKALADRPALKMTVTGAADPAGEAEAWRREALDARLLAERRRELARAGTPAVVPAVVVASGAASGAAAGAIATATAPPPLGAADRERLLRLVYKQTDLPNKPKNLVGFAKDIPLAEMETLLKAALRPNDDAMRELALQRGLAVRDALIARGLPSERLFLAAPKLRTTAEAEAGWKPRVQLSLSTN